MNRTIKGATVKRFHYHDHNQLRTHLAEFMAAYNCARRLKILGGFTPYEYICKIWTSEPDSFILNPIYQMPELNNTASTKCVHPLPGRRAGPVAICRLRRGKSLRDQTGHILHPLSGMLKKHHVTFAKIIVSRLTIPRGGKTVLWASPIAGKPK